MPRPRLSTEAKRIRGTSRSHRKPKPPRADAEQVDATLLAGLLLDRERLRGLIAEHGSTYVTATGLVRSHPHALQLQRVEAAILRLTGRRLRGGSEEFGPPMSAEEREAVDAQMRIARIYFPSEQDEQAALAAIRRSRKRRSDADDA